VVQQGDQPRRRRSGRGPSDEPAPERLTERPQVGGLAAPAPQLATRHHPRRCTPSRNILPATQQITGDHRVQEINGQPPAQEKKGHREHYRQYIVLLVTSPGNHLRPDDISWQGSHTTP